MSYDVSINGPVVFAGLIRLRSAPLPELQGLEYVLNVTATDDNASGGLHPLASTARVIVGVDDVNNNKPVFEEVRIFTSSFFKANLPVFFSCIIKTSLSKRLTKVFN